MVRRRRGREDGDGAVGHRGLAGLRLRRGPAQHPAQQGQPHRRRHLRHPGRPARLRRAHQHLGQHAHAGQGDPPRVPAGRGRRLLDRQGAAQPAAPAQPRLLREGRHLGAARLGAGQDQPRGPGGRAEHRRYLLRRRLLDDVGHPGRHRDQGAQPARQGPGAPARPVDRHLEHLDRLELHRALFPGPPDGGGLRHLPHLQRPPARGLVQRSQHRLRACAPAGPTPSTCARTSAIRCARPTSTTCSPGPRPSCSSTPARRWSSEVSETARLGHARHPPQHDQGLPAAQLRWRWRA